MANWRGATTIGIGRNLCGSAASATRTCTQPLEYLNFCIAKIYWNFAIIYIANAADEVV